MIFVGMRGCGPAFCASSVGIHIWCFILRFFGGDSHLVLCWCYIEVEIHFYLVEMETQGENCSYLVG